MFPAVDGDASRDDLKMLMWTLIGVGLVAISVSAALFMQG